METGAPHLAKRSLSSKAAMRCRSPWRAGSVWGVIQTFAKPITPLNLPGCLIFTFHSLNPPPHKNHNLPSRKKLAVNNVNASSLNLSWCQGLDINHSGFVDEILLNVIALMINKVFCKHYRENYRDYKMTDLLREWTHGAADGPQDCLFWFTLNSNLFLACLYAFIKNWCT